MSTSQIILTIISSSVLAAVLTAFANYFLTSVNYKNEYYKKLLDKRLEAYESVHNFTSLLSSLVHDADEHYLFPYLLSQGIEELDKATIQILLPLKRSMWLSDELADALQQLNILLVELRYSVDKTTDPDRELIRVGSNRLSEIREKRKDVEAIMKRDLGSMHEVELFLAKKEKRTLKAYL